MHNIIIIGSGPSGYTAAIYAARANLSPLMIASEPSALRMPGGQLMFTSEIENYPGFPDGISGPNLMEMMRKQALRFQTRMVEEDVEEVDFASRGSFRVRTASGWYESRSVVVATGAEAQWLRLPDETKYRNRGLSACAVCDGMFFREQEVMVIGGGDTALEEALTLAHHAAKVTVVHRRDTLRASKIMRDRAAANRKIHFLWNTVVTGYMGGEALEAVRLKNLVSGEETMAPISGVFMGIGHHPNTEFLRGALELDEHGYIITHNAVETSVEGVFAAGDVHDNYFRQAITAAGFGCMAAIRAERWLELQMSQSGSGA